MKLRRNEQKYIGHTTPSKNMIKVKHVNHQRLPKGFANICEAIQNVQKGLAKVMKVVQG